MRQSVRQLVREMAVANESIDFQSTMFFNELVMIIKSIKAIKKEEDIADSDEVESLNNIIKHYTNSRIVVLLDKFGPCIELPEIDKNNIFYKDSVRNLVSNADGIAIIRDAGKNAVGGVNLKTGKVSGVYAEVVPKLHMPMDMFTSNRFSPEELAAIILHETGHYITFCEFSSRVITTNQILAGMSKALDKSSTPKEREFVLLTVKQVAGLNDLDVEKLTKSNNNKVIEMVVISSLAKTNISQINSNLLDITASEHIADEYAARHGAGRYLITALEKLHKSGFDKSFRSTPIFLLFEIFKILLLVGSIVIANSSLFQVAIFVLIMDGQSRNIEHGTPEQRFKRVRNQVVENLKDRNLSAEDHKRLTDDLVVIDKSLETCNDRRQFINVILDFVIPSRKDAYKQEQLQADLEDIAANELFRKAADLNQLAKAM